MSPERDPAYLKKFEKVAIPAALFMDKASELTHKEFLFIGSMSVFSLSSKEEADLRWGGESLGGY